MLTRTLSRLFLPILLCLFVVAGVPAINPPEAPTRYMTQFHAVTAPSVEACRHQAVVATVKSIAGRTYFSNLLLRGRDLIVPYLEQYGERFVVRVDVRKNEVRGRARYMEMDVVVDSEKLFKDLQEKRFFYRPALRPLFYIFMAETFDEQQVEERTGRTQILQILNGETLEAGATGQLAYRYLWQNPVLVADDPAIPVAEKTEVVLAEPSAYADPFAEEGGLLQAAREALRNEVEVFLAGSCKTESIAKKEIYFDSYHYVKTQCDLRLVRADTQEVLAHEVIAVSAAHLDAEEARRIATRSAIQKVVPSLLDVYNQSWDKMVLGEANLRVMAIGVSADNIQVLKEVIARIDPDVEIYRRGDLADVAVITVDWNGSHEDLVEMLKLSEFPEFQIEYDPSKGLVLEVL